MLFNILAALPEEMVALRQWINWRYETRKGKITKAPYNPHTRVHASSTAPHTWGTYEEAVARVSAKTGLGFVLRPPIIGIDLDHCVEPDGVLSALAQEIIARLGETYYEWSPSGHGVHLFVRGTLPRALKTRLGEMYTTGRYFTVTGHTLHAAECLLQVTDEEVAWLTAKLTPSTRPSTGAPKKINTADATPIAAPVFAALTENEPLWLPTWQKHRRLEGSEDDQTDSAYEMALARLAVLSGIDDQTVYKLLVQWRREHGIAPKHSKALLLTIANAHIERQEAQRRSQKEEIREKVLDAPERACASDRLDIARQLVHLPLVRLVQMGRGEAHYRAHLENGTVLDLGNYAGFKNAEKWERYVWEYAGKHLFTEKKRWAKICRVLLSLCEVEETEEMSGAAETQAWLSSYLSDLMHHPATVETLKQARPFQDATGQYVQLDAFRTYVRIHCQCPPLGRSTMLGRLRVAGWAEVTLTRTDDDGKRSITRKYWHKAHDA